MCVNASLYDGVDGTCGTDNDRRGYRSSGLLVSRLPGAKGLSMFK